MTNLIVSVIIVSWNAKKYLADCLDSLTEAACAYPMEIIVVDNASSDGSPELVAQRYPHVRLIQTGANLGFAKANNIGIRQATGKYFALVNSDVKVLPGCLTTLVDYCDAHPRVGLAGPYVFGGDGKLQRSCRAHPTVSNMFFCALALDSMFPKFPLFSDYAMLYWDHGQTRQVEILSGCFWLARKDAVARVGGLDESFFMYGEDMDWCKRFALANWEVMFVHEAQAIHYGGASSSNAPLRFFLEMQKADLKYWRKHHSRAGVLAYQLISFTRMALRAIGYGLLSVPRSGRKTVYLQKFQRSIACLRWMMARDFAGEKV